MYESRLSPIYLRYSGRSRPSDSGGSGQPDPEIIGGGGAVSKKSFSGPSGLILVEKWGGGGGRAEKVAKFADDCIQKSVKFREFVEPYLR